MIVERKISAVMEIPITAIENPRQGLDRFLLTVADRINGKSSQVGSKPAATLELARYIAS
jgi:hypothetical protein